MENIASLMPQKLDEVIKFSSSTVSSFLILFAIIAGYARKIAKEMAEPSISGMERNKIMVTLYVG